MNSLASSELRLRSFDSWKYTNSQCSQAKLVLMIKSYLINFYQINTLFKINSPNSVDLTLRKKKKEKKKRKDTYIRLEKIVFV